MAFVLKDRVKETGTAPNTSTFNLSGPVAGFQGFSVIGAGNDTYYAATDAGGNWEVGYGMYLNGPDTISRTTVLESSNAGSAVTFSGTVTIFCTYPAEKSVNLDMSDNTLLPSNLTFTGTAKRITGDFSNATVASRVMLQNSTLNAASRLGLIPNGTSSSASWDAFNNSDPTNASLARFGVTSSDSRFESTITGTGTLLPMAFYTGGSERVRINTLGQTSFTGTGYSPDINLTDATTVAWDTSLGQVATFTFVSSNRTMGAPTNLANGGFYALEVIQNAGSNTLTWNSVFKWPSAVAPTLSTGAGARDLFIFRSDGTNMYLQGQSLGVS